MKRDCRLQSPDTAACSLTVHNHWRNGALHSIQTQYSTKALSHLTLAYSLISPAEDKGSIRSITERRWGDGGGMCKFHLMLFTSWDCAAVAWFNFQMCFFSRSISILNKLPVFFFVCFFRWGAKTTYLLVLDSGWSAFYKMTLTHLVIQACQHVKCFLALNVHMYTVYINIYSICCWQENTGKPTY